MRTLLPPQPLPSQKQGQGGPWSALLTRVACPRHACSEDHRGGGSGACTAAREHDPASGRTPHNPPAAAATAEAAGRATPPTPAPADLRQGAPPHHRANPAAPPQRPPPPPTSVTPCPSLWHDHQGKARAAAHRSARRLGGDSACEAPPRPAAAGELRKPAAPPHPTPQSRARAQQSRGQGRRRAGVGGGAGAAVPPDNFMPPTGSSSRHPPHRDEDGRGWGRGWNLGKERARGTCAGALVR